MHLGSQTKEPYSEVSAIIDGGGTEMDTERTRYIFIPGKRFSSSQGWPVYSIRATSSAVIGVIKPREEFGVSKIEGDYVKVHLKNGIVGWALAVLKGTRFLHQRNDPPKPSPAKSVSNVLGAVRHVGAVPGQAPHRPKPIATSSSYGWQRARGRVKNYQELLQKRRDQLRQVELDKHPRLLDEWMELIKELDAVLRYGFSSIVEPDENGKRKRANSFLDLNVFKAPSPASKSKKLNRKDRAKSFVFQDADHDSTMPIEKPTLDPETRIKLINQHHKLQQQAAENKVQIQDKLRQAAIQKARMQLMEDRARKVEGTKLMPDSHQLDSVKADYDVLAGIEFDSPKELSSNDVDLARKSLTESLEPVVGWSNSETPMSSPASNIQRNYDLEKTMMQASPSKHRIRDVARREMLKMAAQQQEEQRAALLNVYNTATESDKDARFVAAEDERVALAELEELRRTVKRELVEEAKAAARAEVTRHLDTSVASSDATVPHESPKSYKENSNLTVEETIVDFEELIKDLDTPQRMIKVSRAANRLRAAALTGVKNQVHEAYLAGYNVAQDQKAKYQTAALQVALQVVERQREQAFALLARKRQEEEPMHGSFADKKHGVRKQDSILISF